MPEKACLRLGIIGTGFIARHLAFEVERQPSLELGPVLTRRPLDQCADFPYREALTDSLDALVGASDLVFECTGDVEHAATTIGRVLDAGKPVVTLNAEFHATIGSAYVDRGVLSEAEGDQPGCLAALHEDALTMGFTPLVYCNMKAFLNHHPTLEQMQFWAAKQDYSIEMVTSFTDGTKVQIEQCLVANGLGAGIAQEGLLGLPIGDVNDASESLGAEAERRGFPLSEYILDRNLAHGVFVVAKHDPRQAHGLRNFKMGEGPFYTLMRPHCLVHLEALKTVQRVARGGPPLLNNGQTPQVSVASVAKRPLLPGERIMRGAGSFEIRGSCVRIADRPNHLPVCLANALHVRRRVEPGQVLTFDDVDLETSEALSAWRAIEHRVLETARGRTA